MYLPLVTMYHDVHTYRSSSPIIQFTTTEDRPENEQKMYKDAKMYGKKIDDSIVRLTHAWQVEITHIIHIPFWIYTMQKIR